MPNNYTRRAVVNRPDGSVDVIEVPAGEGSPARDAQVNIATSLYYNQTEQQQPVASPGLLSIDIQGHTALGANALNCNFGEPTAITVYLEATLNLVIGAKVTLDQQARPVAFVQWGVAGKTHQAFVDATKPRGKLSMIAEWVSVQVCFEQASWWPGLVNQTISNQTASITNVEIAQGEDPDFTHNTRLIPANNGTILGAGDISQILLGPGRITSIVAFDESATGGNFLQIFDAGPAPTNGSVPVISYPLPATPALISLNVGQDSDLTFQRGAWWAISSTPDSLTLVAAAAARVDAWVLR